MDMENSFEIEGETFFYFDLKKVFSDYPTLYNLPISLKILLEESLRKAADEETINKIIKYFLYKEKVKLKINASRVIMKEYSAVPMLIDLASIRNKLEKQNLNTSLANPSIMVDVIIEDSIKNSVNNNSSLNDERCSFIKWAQNSFTNIRVIPPGSGICHEVNLEYLSTIINITQKDGKNYLYPEILLGTDSYASTANAIGVLGITLGPIDIQASLLGFNIELDFPKVFGIKLEGQLSSAVISNDLIYELKQLFKSGRFDGMIVEFYGIGVKELTLEDRATISSLSNEFNILSIFFPIDDKALAYYNNTRDNEDFSKLLKTYLDKQSLLFDNRNLNYDESIVIKLQEIKPLIFGPKNAKQKIEIEELQKFYIVKNDLFIKDGDIVLCAITSCDTPSNPYFIMHLGLIAKKAYEINLQINPNISKVIALRSSYGIEYLRRLDLLQYFEKLGFEIISDACIDDFSKYLKLDQVLENEIKVKNLNLVCVTSESIVFDKKLHPLINSYYTMSASLCLIYALMGNIKSNVFEKSSKFSINDIWPDDNLILEYFKRLDCSLYKNIFSNIYSGNEFWNSLDYTKSNLYLWNNNSTFIQQSNFIDDSYNEIIDIKNAKIVCLFDDDISIDLISPLGQIPLYSPAAKYLEELGVKSFEYGYYEIRKGNSDIMLRSVFSNTKLKNRVVTKEGGFTKDFEESEIVSIYEFSKRAKKKNIPLVIFAGKNYGVGTPRAWAIKGTRLLGVKAIIAKSFDDTHRSNLISYGVLPLEFIEDESIDAFDLIGDESIDIFLDDEIKINALVSLHIKSDIKDIKTLVKCRLDTYDEVSIYKNAGTLSMYFKSLLKTNNE